MTLDNLKTELRTQIEILENENKRMEDDTNKPPFIYGVIEENKRKIVTLTKTLNENL